MAGLFSDNTLEQIRAASDIVDVIGGYLPLKRAGANFTALCPFHKEKSPSFNVNPHKQIFHCFGCHKGGDVFTFVKEYENIGFVDAVRRLAERAKIPLEAEQNPAAQESRHLKDQLLEIHEQLTQRWQSCLANEAAGQLARDYLAKRGVSVEAIKLFRIGAAPESWDDTVNWARSKGHDLAVVEKAGLILKKEGSEHHYDRFRGRLMFPICDEQGRVIGFSGRVLAGDEKTAKYVNSPETAIFTKSKVLFALDKAKRGILDKEFAVVCEGQLDTIACHMSGVPNVVAPQGTALTAMHARILRRYTDDIILCFDSDAAGQRASARSFDDLLAAGIHFRVATIPAPDDPDSFLKRFGQQAFVDLLIQAKEFHGFFLDFLCSQQDLRTDVGKLKIIDMMKAVAQKTANPAMIDIYAQKTANRLGVSLDSMRIEFKKGNAIPSAAPGISDDVTTATAVAITPSKFEFGLLQLLFRSDEFFDWAAQHLDPIWIKNETVRQLIGRRLAAQETESWQGLSAFLVSLDTQSQQLLNEALARNYLEEVATGELQRGIRDHLRGRAIPQPFEEVRAIVTRLRNDYIERQLPLLDQKSTEPDLSDEERAELLRQALGLRNLKRQPLTPLG